MSTDVPPATRRPTRAPIPGRHPAQRALSANLTGAQRRALSQFLDGQISAGALSELLEAARQGRAAA